jgi:hypothetical protein
MVCWQHFRQGVFVARAGLRLLARFYLTQQVPWSTKHVGYAGSGEQTADTPLIVPTLRNTVSGPDKLRPAITRLHQDAVQRSTVEHLPITGYSCRRSLLESCPSDTHFPQGCLYLLLVLIRLLHLAPGTRSRV